MKTHYAYVVGLLFLLISLSVPALAADSVEVDGMVYQVLLPPSPKTTPKTTLLRPGQVVRVGEDCSTDKSDFFRHTKVCMWKKTVTATVDSIVVTEGGTELSESVITEVSAAVLAIVFMIVAVVLYVVSSTLAAAFAAAVVTIATWAAVLMAYSFVPVLIFAAALFLALNSVVAIIKKRSKKEFYWSASVHIVMMVATLVLMRV